MGKHLKTGEPINDSGQPSIYQGMSIALLTLHRKEEVIEPTLRAEFGCAIELTRDFDTNTLGTFTRETPRKGTQIESARRKARIGMEITGLRLGLGSEGAFGPDPITGLVGWNVEILVLVDDILGVEITGMAQGYAKHGHILSDNWNDILLFAEKAGFPEHHLVARPDNEKHPSYKKGISDWASLEWHFSQCQRESKSGKVLVENDLRASHNPSRMQMIMKATENLARKANSLCPSCQGPGYFITGYIPGRLCRLCGSATNEIKGEIWACPGCKYNQTHHIEESSDPSVCPKCNP